MTTKPKKLSVSEERQLILDRIETGLADAKDAAQELFDDLDEKRGNMEENFSSTERYARFEGACAALEEIIGMLDGIDLPEIP